MTHAAAQELRADGIHVALLVVEATIDSPKTARFIAGRPENESADMAEIARAVEYLANQSRAPTRTSSWSHPPGIGGCLSAGSALTISNASSTADRANSRWMAAGPRTRTRR